METLRALDWGFPIRGDRFVKALHQIAEVKRMGSEDRMEESLAGLDIFGLVASRA